MRSSRLPVPWSFAMASLSNVRISPERISVVAGWYAPRLVVALGRLRNPGSSDECVDSLIAGSSDPTAYAEAGREQLVKWRKPHTMARVLSAARRAPNRASTRDIALHGSHAAHPSSSLGIESWQTKAEKRIAEHRRLQTGALATTQKKRWEALLAGNMEEAKRRDPQ